MLGKLQTKEDRELLGKLKRTYRLSIKSLDTFKRYKHARNFIIKNFDDLHSPTTSKILEGRIKKKIINESERIIDLIKTKYDNDGSRNYYLSSYKMIYQSSTAGGTNPYYDTLQPIREDIRNQPHPNTRSREIRDEMIESTDSQTLEEALWKLINNKVEVLNSWINKTYKCDNVEEFNKKFHRSFNREGVLTGEIDLNKKGSIKFVNIARSILAVSLQAGKGHILRSEARSLRFYQWGTGKRQNLYSLRKNTIKMYDYKTVNTRGGREYACRELDKQMIMFIRVFNDNYNVFCTKGGRVVNSASFIRYYKAIYPDLRPMILRKILIDISERTRPDTGNNEFTRQKYYRIEDRPDDSDEQKKTLESTKQDEPEDSDDDGKFIETEDN